MEDHFKNNNSAAEQPSKAPAAPTVSPHVRKGRDNRAPYQSGPKANRRPPVWLLYRRMRR